VTILHQWRYREQYERAKDKFTSVLETPEYESHRRSKKISDVSVSFIFWGGVEQLKSKAFLYSGSFTTLPETRDTVHSKQINKLISGKLYKAKFEKEKGKSIYNQMIVPPDVQHAIDVAKCQSNVSRLHNDANIFFYISQLLLLQNICLQVSYKKDAKANLHYTSVVDRPDIKKATQAAKLISGLKYKEKFDKEMKGKKPQYDLKDSKIYQTLKDASVLASEVKYKGDLKKIHKPVTDMAESLSMQHNLSTSKLSTLNAFQTTQIKHLTLNVCGLFQVKYKEKYEKEKGKAMLDFETPTYVTAKEAQHMQSQVSTLSASSVLKTASNREYKKAMELEIKGKGMLALATDTPDFMRARNATDILSQAKYKHTAEMDRASYTSVIDTPDIIHAQQMRNIVSQNFIQIPAVFFVEQKKYREEAEKTMSHYVPVLDTPEMQRVRENQKNFSTLHLDVKSSSGVCFLCAFLYCKCLVFSNQEETVVI
uniref:Nebulette n=1 Tax=Labrus bergylta TaxID=56723 RepID=A0A3Q3MJH9_9LABR